MSDPFSAAFACQIHPLTYPGKWVQEPTVVTPDEMRRGLPEDRRGVPVLAIGSNASPATLRHKFAAVASWQVMLEPVRVEGWSIGFAPFITRYGAIPATPYPEAGASTEAFISWLPEELVALMDETEPVYDRIPYDDEGTWVYVSHGGVLSLGEPLTLGGTGPRSVASQKDLWSRLYAVPEFEQKVGVPSHEIVQGRVDPWHSVQVFLDLGLVSPNPALAVPLSV